MSWAKLLKPKEEEPEQDIQPIGPENSVQEEDETLKMGPQKMIPEEDNPFALTNEEANAISAAQDLITTDPEKIKTVTQIRDPAAYALAHMQIAWERQEGAADLAALDEALISNLAMFECARSGEDNRAKLFAKAIQAITTQEFELEKSTGSKLLGQKG